MWLQLHNKYFKKSSIFLYILSCLVVLFVEFPTSLFFPQDLYLVEWSFLCSFWSCLPFSSSSLSNHSFTHRSVLELILVNSTSLYFKANFKMEQVILPSLPFSWLRKMHAKYLWYYPPQHQDCHCNYDCWS